MRRTLGIDIGAKGLVAVVREPDGRHSHKWRSSMSRSLNPTHCVRIVRHAVQLAGDSAGPVHAVGIGVPGLVEPIAGLVRRSVVLPTWHTVPLATLVTLATELPCEIDSSVNNSARAELAVRRNTSSFVFISSDDETGGAIVLDRTLWPGISGLAGQIAHTQINPSGELCACGKRGCVGPHAGATGVAQRLGVTPENLADYLREHGDRAAPIVGEAGAALGQVIAVAMNLLNVGLVVLGGELAGFGIYRDIVERTARRAAVPEVAADWRLETARGGSAAGAVGAAILAQHTLQRRTDRPVRSPA